jgi:hypothetical protein
VRKQAAEAKARLGNFDLASVKASSVKSSRVAADPLELAEQVLAELGMD